MIRTKMQLRMNLSPAGTLLWACLFTVASTGVAETSVVDRPDATRTNRFYVSNRAPLAPSPFVKLPIGSITPKGWVRHMLELEREGMTGRLKEISPWLDFTKSAWGNKEGKGERGWEELPYWLKGYGDLGYVLKDDVVTAEARRWIDAVLSSQREDGWFGPRELLKSLEGKPDLWPHMVMLNVLQSFYEATGDARVLPFMTRYFEWENQLPPSAFGEGYWPKIRAGDNLESCYWLYNRTGHLWLLDLTKKIHQNMARWNQDVINWHNVNIAQGFRAGTERLSNAIRTFLIHTPDVVFHVRVCRAGHLHKSRRLRYRARCRAGTSAILVRRAPASLARRERGIRSGQRDRVCRRGLGAPAENGASMAVRPRCPARRRLYPSNGSRR